MIKGEALYGHDGEYKLFIYPEDQNQGTFTKIIQELSYGSYGSENVVLRLSGNDTLMAAHFYKDARFEWKDIVLFEDGKEMLTERFSDIAGIPYATPEEFVQISNDASLFEDRTYRIAARKPEIDNIVCTQETILSIAYGLLCKNSFKQKGPVQIIVPAGEDYLSYAYRAAKTIMEALNPWLLNNISIATNPAEPDKYQICFVPEDQAGPRAIRMEESGNACRSDEEDCYLAACMLQEREPSGAFCNLFSDESGMDEIRECSEIYSWKWIQEVTPSEILSWNSFFENYGQVGEGLQTMFKSGLDALCMKGVLSEKSLGNAILQLLRDTEDEELTVESYFGFGKYFRVLNGLKYLKQLELGMDVVRSVVKLIMDRREATSASYAEARGFVEAQRQDFENMLSAESVAWTLQYISEKERGFAELESIRQQNQSELQRQKDAFEKQQEENERKLKDANEDYETRQQELRDKTGVLAEKEEAFLREKEKYEQEKANFESQSRKLKQEKEQAERMQLSDPNDMTQYGRFEDAGEKGNQGASGPKTSKLELRTPGDPKSSGSGPAARIRESEEAKKQLTEAEAPRRNVPDRKPEPKQSGVPMLFIILASVAALIMLLIGILIGIGIGKKSALKNASTAEITTEAATMAEVTTAGDVDTLDNMTATEATKTTAETTAATTEAVTEPETTAATVATTTQAEAEAATEAGDGGSEDGEEASEENSEENSEEEDSTPADGASE